MHLTYVGDVSETVIGQIMGPDLHGGLSEAVEAEYFPLADITRVRFTPFWPGSKPTEFDEHFQRHVISDE